MLYNEDINYYFRINFAGFEQLINSLMELLFILTMTLIPRMRQDITSIRERTT